MACPPFCARHAPVTTHPKAATATRCWPAGEVPAGFLSIVGSLAPPSAHPIILHQRQRLPPRLAPLPPPPPCSGGSGHVSVHCGRRGGAHGAARPHQRRRLYLWRHLPKGGSLANGSCCRGLGSGACWCCTNLAQPSPAQPSPPQRALPCPDLPLVPYPCPSPRRSLSG